MKKSIIWILLALALSLSLCACGGAKTAQPVEEKETVEATEALEELTEESNVEEANPETEKINLVAEIAKCTSGLPVVTLPEGTFLFKNDSCALELVNLYQEEANWNGCPGIYSGMTVKFHNYLNEEISFNFDDCYYGDEKAKAFGLADHVAGGKTGLFTFVFARESSDPTVDHIPISSLEDLMKIEGTIWWIADSASNVVYESFALADFFK